MKALPLAAMSSVLGLALSISAFAKDDFPEVTEDGLHRLADSKLSVVYTAPGADLSVYNKVMLLDATVAFKKHWQRDQNRSYSFKVSSKDMDRIKAGLAELFNEVFTESLREGGYAIALETGEDVLIVRPAIVNLDVKAPDTRSVGRGYQLTRSAGEMTLYIELFDSVTSDIIGKALDRREDRQHSSFQWQTQGGNRIAAKKILKSWAGALVDALDDAHAAKEASEGVG